MYHLMYVCMYMYVSYARLYYIVGVCAVLYMVY